ncbi:Acetyltransferase (GNAT) family protein [Roseovarius marisflavi]|uniref:Acetyltransferase (GNAT) family protein n=1 Tax=Roseovarius marisflavi TaxID=1054996 RepID=A0A1M7C6E9_9RHOB|nr:GNAT family protein [Roseovarius marisflavi]SHL62801.1 Acetyltransferase (GNAT) family protein [Roseovarius marisflavi]
MTSTGQDYFGTEAQISVLRRGRALFDLTDTDLRMTYYGRSVGLADTDAQAMDRLAALIALQGNSALGAVEDGDIGHWQAEAQRRNLTITHYARWLGTQKATQTARTLLDLHPLPQDLTVIRVDRDAPAEAMAQLADVSLACGVLPPSGAVLRGVRKPGIGLVALDQTGKGVACAGAASYWHPDHPKGQRQCWWGMLATLPERRGQRLALILGAMAVIEMQERYGFTEVFTGVTPGNAASEAVCARLGLRAEGTNVLAFTDPHQLPGGRMTK